MKKHIGETRETVKPPQHQTIIIALTAPLRLHSFVSHRFHLILLDSFITTKNATISPILAIFTLFSTISIRTAEQNATQTTLNATLIEHYVVKRKLYSERLLVNLLFSHFPR